MQPVVTWPHGVEDPAHVWMLCVREPGDLSSTRWWMLYRVGWGRPVAAIPTCTLLRSLTSAYNQRRSGTTWRNSAMAETLEERPVTKGKFWKDVCDLYAETGGSIVRT